MSNMTEMDLQALKRYAYSLESSKSNISRYCSDLVSGIDSCSNYMQDENSRKALKKGRQVAVDIMTCISAVDRILEMVYRIIHEMESSHDFEVL